MMNFENIVKEASHKRPPTVGFHSYEMSGIGKSRQTENRLVVARD